MRTLIRGGTVVSQCGSGIADVFISGHRISAIFDSVDHTFPGLASECDLVVDARGKLVIPGGVDAHTHLESIGQGTYVPDTFETGTRAAALGGTTTIIDFASPTPGQSMYEAVEGHYSRANGSCAVDYGFHVFTVGASPSVLHDMSELIKDGITSFKMFMAYPGRLYSNDGEILRVMQHASECGGLVMMHAENGIAIDVLREQAIARGDVLPRFHATTRPSILEAEAVNRASVLAQIANVPLYIVHLSSESALNALTRARSRGRNIFAETCPQYLFLDESMLNGPFEQSSRFVCSPPLRPREHQEALWTGLRNDELQIVATDHCPFCLWQRELGRDDFRKIPNGLPGIEHRVELLYSGVKNGYISPSRWVELLSTSPAKMFGLFPQKGVIAPGSDADIVIFDPSKSRKISASNHSMNVDNSVYENIVTSGTVDTVLLRGKPIVVDGRYIGRQSDGVFQKRDLCQYLL